jgi:hypothetical protein
MIRRVMLLWVSALALLPTALPQSASNPDADVDFRAFVQEIQQTTREPGYLGILRWTPVQFWEKSAERAAISAEKAQERDAPLRKHTVILAGVGKIGIANIELDFGA